MFRIHRMSYSYFFDNPPPFPHSGWTRSAFQDYCHSHLEAEGFNLNKKLHCVFDHMKREIVWWQEPSDLFDSSSLN